MGFVKSTRAKRFFAYFFYAIAIGGVLIAGDQLLKYMMMLYETTYEHFFIR